MADDPTTSREEGVLKRYFQRLGELQFEAAREVCDTERDARRSFGGQTWSKFLQELSRLAAAERVYHSLEFLEQRWFARKEELKDSYQLLLSEIGRISEIYAAQRGGTAPGWERRMATLCSAMCAFVRARRDILDVYNQLAAHATTPVDFTVLEALTVQVSSRFNAHYFTGLVDPLRVSLMREVQMLQLLLTAQLHVSSWQLLPSLYSLRTCQEKLRQWQGIQPLDKRLGKRASRASFSLSKTPQWPVLYQWMCRFYTTLVAKVSLYFHQILSQQMGPSEMKSLLSKTDTDLFAKLNTLRRRTEAQNISLVLDTNGSVPSFTGHGYHLPACVPDPPVGLASYPAILSMPSGHPRQLWPAVVSLLQEHEGKLSNMSSGPIKFVDQRVGLVYFLGKVEPRIYVVAVYTNRRAERDTSILSALSDVLNYLRLTELFSLLRMS